MKISKGQCGAITGAASGIGRAVAVLLAEKGMDLALSDVNEIELETSAELCRAKGVKVETTKVNVANREEMEAWAAKTAETFKEINFIFNNAGVSIGNIISTMKYEDMEWLMNINFWGVVYGTKAFLPYLKKSSVAHIANVSSIYGLVGIPTQSAYCASKFAVRGFTDSLIIELKYEAPHVGVTCIHPAGIKTNVAKSARFGDVGSWGSSDKAETVKNYERLFVNSAETAAKIIVRSVEKNKVRQLVGLDAIPYDILARLLPNFYHKIIGFIGQRIAKK